MLQRKETFIQTSQSTRYLEIQVSSIRPKSESENFLKFQSLSFVVKIC